MLVRIMTMPTTRFRVTALARFAMAAAIFAQRSVKTTQRMRHVTSGMPPMAKWLMPPVSAVNAMMNTLVPTAMCISAKDPLPVDAAAQEVTLRIEGAAKNLYYKKVALQENDTVLTLLERVLKDAKLTYTVTDSSYGGKYLSELAGEKEAAFGGYDGWMYAVNGEMPMDTIDAHALKAGDSVLLYFGDMSILQPIVTVVRSEDAVALKVEADVTTYDEQWNPTTTRQPIAQAKLTVDGAAQRVSRAEG